MKVAAARSLGGVGRKVGEGDENCVGVYASVLASGEPEWRGPEVQEQKG